jgi:hypothetical protein
LSTHREVDTVAKDIDGGGCVAGMWLIGWLFTIGFAHLTVKQSLLGLVIWAYYLGVKLAGTH